MVMMILLLLSSSSSLKQSALAQNNHNITTILSHSQSSNSTKITTIGNFLTYQNPTYGIQIQYPSDWTISQTGLRDYTNIVAFYSPLENLSDVFPEHVLLSVMHYSKNITLNDYTNLVNATLKQPGIQIVESNPITLTAGNLAAHRIVFLPPAGINTPFKPEIMLVWTVKGDKVYTIAYNAEATKYSIYLPIVQKMIASLEIK
jgi:serine/threonine-protein kinase